MSAFRPPRLVLSAAFLALGTLTACVTSEESGKNTDRSGSDTTETDVTWFSSATHYRGEHNLRVTYDCPANGHFSVVWGTDTYTDNSSVCTAAVHAGKITREAGGRVVIEIRPGEDSYASSTRNGVTSSNWGLWSGSFVFP